MVFKALIEIV